MTALLDELVTLLDVARVGDTAFVGQHPAGVMKTGHVFGGLVAGQATVAAYKPSRPAGRCTRCTPTSCVGVTR